MPSVITTRTQTTAGVASAKFLDKNGRRSSIAIQNLDAGTIHINPGDTDATTDDLKLLPNDLWEPYVVPKEAIQIISTLASNKIVIWEGVSGPLPSP